MIPWVTWDRSVSSRDDQFLKLRWAIGTKALRKQQSEGLRISLGEARVTRKQRELDPGVSAGVLRDTRVSAHLE